MDEKTKKELDKYIEENYVPDEKKKQLTNTHNAYNIGEDNDCKRN